MTLMLKPGVLAVDFVQGKRVRYMRPIQLFLVLNIFLFFVPGNPFALHLENYVTFKPFINYGTKEAVSKGLTATHLTFAEYAAQFDEKIQSQSKAFIFLYIPFYALVFSLLFVTKRRLLSEQLVFASHFMSFYMILSVLTFLLISYPVRHLTNFGGSQYFENVATFINVFAIFWYLMIAFGRFYRSGIVWSVLAAAFVALSFFTVIQFYRMFLFYKIVSI